MVRISEYIPYIAAAGGTLLLLGIAERNREKEKPTPKPKPHVPVNYIDGYVRDENLRTGIKGAVVKYGGKVTTTNYAGYYKIENVPVSGVLTVTAPNYQPYVKRIVVPSKGGKRVDVYLRSKIGYCAATFTSEPSNALIYFNGRYIGNTPFSAVLPCGTHLVMFRHSGYAPAVKYVRFIHGFVNNIHAYMGRFSSRVVVSYERPR